MKRIIACVLCVSLLISILPIISLANDYSTEIIFAIDTSVDMLYNNGAEDALADSLSGVIEQAPTDSSFGVVTENNTTGLTDSETAMQNLYDLTYDNACDVLSVVDDAVGLFSSNSNKILFISTDKLEAVLNTVEVLENQGMTVYVINFESNETVAEEIRNTYDNIIVCQNAKEISYRLADVYEEIFNLKLTSNSVQLMSVPTITYNSSFRGGSKAKHNFGENITDYKKGAILVALLNMYYLMPARVENGYEITDYEKIKSIANGVTNSLLIGLAEKNTFLGFWEKKATSLLSSQAYVKETTGISESLSVIEDNLKRRFPVMISLKDQAVSNSENEIYLITKLVKSGDDYTFYLYNSANDSVDLETKTVADFAGKQVKILNTQKYFYSIYEVPSIKRLPNENESGTIYFSLPENYLGAGYKFVPNDNVSEEITLSNNEIKPEKTFDVDIPANGEFSIVFDVVWQSLVPNLNNSTMNFRIIPFIDVGTAHWAYPYIFDMANRKVINGRGENIFGPEDNATIEEYLAMTIRAADVSGNQEWVFPDGYVNYAMEKKLITAETDCTKSITRELAFDITWKVLTLEDCRNPTTLVDYKIDVFSDMVPFTDKSNVSGDYQNSIANLYKNGIVAGYPEGDLRPEENITRAETAKILSKCIGSFDAEKQIIPFNDGSVHEALDQIPIGVTTRGVIGNNGSMAFTFHTDSTGLYPITLTGDELNIDVYESYDSYGVTKYRPCYPKANKTGTQYPILENKNMVVVVSGNADAEFELNIGEAVQGNTSMPTERKAYIVFYDSPIKRYLGSELLPTPTPAPENETTLISTPISETETEPTPTPTPVGPTPKEWDRYQRYDITDEEKTAFFKNYLEAFYNITEGPDDESKEYSNCVKPVFVLSVRDVDLNGKRSDNADKAESDSYGDFNYNNTNQDKYVQFGDISYFDIPSKVQEQIPELGMSFAQYKKMAVENVSEEMVNIIKGFNAASIELGVDMPEFYIGMPHCGTGPAQDKQNFAEKYYDLAIGVSSTESENGTEVVSNSETKNNDTTTNTPGIYYAVLEGLSKAGIASSCITGLYNGWEDGEEIYDANNEYTVGYDLLVKISKFAHKEKKKFLWIPYGGMDHIGKYVNTAVYHNDEDKKSYDLYDVVITQPGMFFEDNFKITLNGKQVNLVEFDNDSKNEGKTREERIDISNENMLIKLFDIFHSMRLCRAVTGSTGTEEEQSGEVVKGGKFTDTQFGCEIEYDMGLITGRWYEGLKPSFSKQKAQNFLIVLDVLKSFIYSDNVIFATYSGGMNEQAYDLVGTGVKNNNRHSIINYQTGLGVRLEKEKEEEEEEEVFPRNSDYGNGKPYTWFYDNIIEMSKKPENVFLKNEMQYNLPTVDDSEPYPKDLLYEITVGIMKNQWSQGVKDFLAIPDEMLVQTKGGAPDYSKGYYEMIIYREDEVEEETELVFYYTYPEVTVNENQ